MVEWNAEMEHWTGTLEWNNGIVIYHPAYQDEIKVSINVPSLVLLLELCTILSDYNNQLPAGT